jgi:hypothetical protein
MNAFELLDDDGPVPTYRWDNMWGGRPLAPWNARKVLCGGEWAKSEPSKKKQDGVSSAARKQRILEAMMKLSERDAWCWCDEIAPMVGAPPYVTPQSIGRHLREMALLGMVKRSPNKHSRPRDASNKRVHLWALA